MTISETMAKLINLNVYDAKNMICVWNENDPDESWRCGIACDDSDCGFMIPMYYVVGVYDDGTTKAGGIHNLDEINDLGADLFLYNEFCYCVTDVEARAFVRHEIGDSNCDEDQAKDIVYEKLQKSGVRITDNARRYLTH